MVAVWKVFSRSIVGGSTLSSSSSVVIRRGLHRSAFNMECKGGNVPITANAVQPLLTVDEAFRLHAKSNVKFLDASWHMDKARDPRNDFLNSRIAGANYFNIDQVSDTSSPLPHMLPSEAQFADAVSNLGINNDDHVIVYTVKDSFSAARVWWTFRLFGHRNVSILQGGLNAWKRSHGPIESGPLAPVKKTDYVAKANHNMVVNADQVLAVVNTGVSQILDARSNERFLAKAPEPRPGLAGGHIPGSLNLPFTELVKPDDFSTFRSPAEIRDAIVGSGVIMGSNVILSCGSGVSAAVLCFGFHLLGKDIVTTPIYDGSWTEWASRGDLPIMKPE